ncbi:MAG: hypothetical protein WAT67_05905 [Candidatus Contendobacter sp.]
MAEQILLSSSPFDGMREIGGFGQPLHALYPQIHKVLSSELGLEMADLLAEPVVDRARNRIDWYTEGDPDQPRVLLSALPEEQRQATLAQVQGLLERGREVAERYIASDDPRQTQLGVVLRAALSTPAENELFLLDNRPVMIRWGFVVDGLWEPGGDAGAPAAGLAAAPSAVEPPAVAIPEPAVPELTVAAPPTPETPTVAQASVPALELGLSESSQASVSEPALASVPEPAFDPALQATSQEPATPAYSETVQPEATPGQRSGWFWFGLVLLLLVLLALFWWLWGRPEPTVALNEGGESPPRPRLESGPAASRPEASDGVDRAPRFPERLPRNLGPETHSATTVRPAEATGAPIQEGSATTSEGAPSLPAATASAERITLPSAASPVADQPAASVERTAVVPAAAPPASDQTVSPTERAITSATNLPAKDRTEDAAPAAPRSPSHTSSSAPDPTAPQTPRSPGSVAVQQSSRSASPARTESATPQATLEELLAERAPAAASSARARQPSSTTQPPAPPPSEPIAQNEPVIKTESTPEERREFRDRLSETGAATGEITVTLLWNGPGDLDLVVRCPSGQQLDYRNPAVCGGSLDVDANTTRANLSERPVENAFWAAGQAGPGRYEIAVRYAPRKDERNPTPTSFQVRLLRGGQESAFKGVVWPNTIAPVTIFTVAP